MTSDFWITFHGGGEALILGTPRGRQFAGGSSPECEPSARSSTSALAQGINGTSPGLRSAAMSRMYLAPPDSQTPDRSGWPSGDRGGGAGRVGVSPGPLGTLPGGAFTHPPLTGAQISTRTAPGDKTPDTLPRLTR